MRSRSRASAFIADPWASSKQPRVEPAVARSAGVGYVASAVSISPTQLSATSSSAHPPRRRLPEPESTIQIYGTISDELAQVVAGASQGVTDALTIREPFAGFSRLTAA